ncbi:MAG: DsbE family thiol:disulfide interchange protein [Magnetococcales bacterium]|nr:DsbE family thiol:disulfide interchange protein [Magnetococcales bacterium]MBF0151790.1 DsbE family thiol:disulfide interchange protein [Magnetococcales bacterium]MBF0174665.1 DsbE family thiol:disulfide interchange protein [Magnetococcales bacterium]MBF0348379.1 DsbE family thiol:disulfide interchange protein [Magnetococcales bacterium]
MKNLWKVILLSVVVIILVLFALGLENDPRNIPSPLVGRPAPLFSAPALDDGPPIVMESFRGRWLLVNFWGSWCGSCVREHSYLIELARKTATRNDFVMIGVDFKDTKEGGRSFLASLGNPGYRHVFDPDQKVAIDWGVYGAPETYLVDPTGIVRHKQVGPLFDGWFEQIALPIMEKKP